MSKEIYISSTPHETRLAIVENDALTEIYYERENEYTLAGSIYNGKVTRVLPGMQSSFVDIGLERDAFLYITDFMEEAPDSAEFDTASPADGPSREARVPRLDASTEAPQAEGQPRGSQSRENQARPGQGNGERHDRGDRGRGRGRRDRTPNGNRTPQADQPAPAEFSLIEDEPAFETPRMAPLATGEPELTLSTDTSELGEGAPGADGGRRWRGRRGRRRGRSPVTNGAPVDESPRATLAGSEQPGLAVESAPHFEEEERSEPPANVEIPASLWGSVSEQPEVQQEQPYVQSRGEGQVRNDSGRNDRGRGRDRNDRSARAPRGFAPSRSLYGVDAESEGTTAEAPAEPIILPGESLSKYRSGGESPTPSAALTPAPTPEFRITGWDGGSVLPGESLSRHRRSESQPISRAEVRSTPQVAFTNPAPLPVAPEVIVPIVILEADGASVGETPETQPEVALAAHPELVPESETIHELSANAEPTAPVEHEPEEGFASYRVDPIPPSEYRQSAPVEEALAAVEEPAPGPSEVEVLASLEEDQPSHDGFGKTHFLTPEPIGPEPILFVETAHAPAIGEEPTLGRLIGDETEFHPTVESSSAASLPAHDITTINPMGEMSSTPHDLEPATVHVAAPQETPDLAAPIHPEMAVLAPASPVQEQTEAFEEEAEESLSQHFAPGQGDLEEEVIEEDEYEVTALHASYDDEMDDLEEETLEGAADLGTMLREMSIDQITRPAPEDGDEDALDEDLEESEESDQLHSEQLDEDSEEYAGTADSAGDFSNEFQEPSSPDAATAEGGSYNERRGGRRDVRRGGGRDRDAARRTGGDSSGRPRNTGGGGDRDRGRSGGGRGRMSMQSTNLPAISELLKPGQEILVQIAKEPIAKKGARITSHIALPGRFLVFMPTVNHTGVSRKIESDGERRRLKEILLSEKGEAAGGFIVRTAASGASEEELRSDLRFLLNLWADIKNRSESSKSPALIYHDLNLVERILRDQVTDNFSAIWVDSETEYERVLRFLQRFQPGLIRRVKLYGKETPLFEQFGITEEINKALRSKVWLKSGGSIVINQTEALVAIDINTGKFVGKTARLEDTIVKTNLDAIPEIVRQIRLRDLGGIIIIDFIDMDERKNRNRVMAALEEELKSDRAPSKVLQFNDFGLVAITRKRVKQSLERTLSTTCGVCQGTGMVKSPVTVCNDIYVEMRKMYKHLDKGDVMLRVHPEVVKQLKSSGTRWLQEMEEMSGKTILIKSDPALHPEQFDIH